MCREQVESLLKKLSIIYDKIFSKVFPIITILVAIVIATVYGIMFYVFGGFEAIIYKDIQIYNSLILSSFSLAGFSMVTAGFLTRAENEVIRKFAGRFFRHASVFIFTGMLLFSNIMLSEINKYFPDAITKDATINNMFKFFLIVGGVGILLFFLELADLTRSFVNIFSFLKEK